MVKALYIQSLSEINERTPISLVGIKARNLGSLLHAGFPVSEGFVVTTEALSEVMNRSGISKTIAGLTAGMDNAEADAVAERMESIRRVFIELSIPAVVEASIRQAYENLGGGSPQKAAVRISLAAENLPDLRSAFSVAGDPDEVVEAVRGCWASYFAERVSFRAKEGRDPFPEFVAALVQRMVDADVSGVMFTCDPSSGDMQRIVINAGERLSPEVFHIERSSFTIVERNCGESGPSGLTEEFSRALARLGTRVEDHFGAPQEIKWRLFADHFSIIGTRAVNIDFTKGGLTVWGRFNLGEILPGVMTPFTWSASRRYLEHSVPRFFERVGSGAVKQVELWGNISGRIYANLSAAAEMLGQIPLLDLKRVHEFRGTQIELRLRSSPTPSFKQKIAALPKLWRAVRLMMTRKKRAAPALENFVRHHDKFLGADIKSRSDAALYLLFDEALGEPVQEALSHLYEAIYNMVVLFGAMENILARGGFQGKAGSMWKMFAGSGGIKSAEPMSEVWKLGRLAKACELTDLIQTRRQYSDFTGAMLRADGDIFLKRMRAFLDEFGHRCIEEGEFSRPRWAENPDVVYTMIEATLETPEDADPAMWAERLRAGAAAAERDAEGSLRGWAKPVFRRLLKSARAATVECDTLRFQIAKSFKQARALAMEAGRRFADRGIIDKQDDIFYLTIEEIQKILGMLPFAGDPKTITRERREEYDDFAALPEPPAVIVGELSATDLDQAPVLYADDTDCITGIGASFGVHRGPARVLRHPSEYSRLRPGDIIVAPQMDVNWSPLLTLVGAVVTESGGPLSNAAVVAREVGMPIVVSAPHACSLIQDGQVITVDGEEGRVWLKDKPELSEGN